jgi:hypothetical protein
MLSVIINVMSLLPRDYWKYHEQAFTLLHLLVYKMITLMQILSKLLLDNCTTKYYSFLRVSPVR